MDFDEAIVEKFLQLAVLAEQIDPAELETLKELAERLGYGATADTISFRASHGRWPTSREWIPIGRERASRYFSFGGFTIEAGVGNFYFSISNQL